MIWLVNLVSALLQICCLLSMAAFFINILLFTYFDYNLHILVVCRGGHISYFIWSNIRYVTDDITIVKTLPPLLVCFSLLTKQLTFFTQICVMFLIVQARSPILHKGHLERYDKQQGNQSVSQFLNGLFFTSPWYIFSWQHSIIKLWNIYVYIVSLIVFFGRFHFDVSRIDVHFY